MELKDGNFALFEITGKTNQRVFGIPTGFWIGFFGCLFATLALWAIAREARPLRQLEASMKGFGSDGVPRPIALDGAPEIKQLIDTLNAMQTRISALIKGRTILLGAVSHDLKTFITRLRLRVEEIPDEDKQKKAVSDLDDMTRMIEDAIAIAAPLV